jgi:uncharacterized protein
MSLQLFLILFIGIAAGFADSTIGVGGSISIPSLIILGFPPAAAIALDRLGTLGQTFGALLKFIRTNKILWSFIIPFIILSQIATLIGTHILLNINPNFILRVLGIILILLTPTFYINKKIGVKRIKVSNFRKCLGYFFYFLLMILNGVTGAGAGGISFYNSMYNFGFTLLEANATNLIPWLLLSLTSSYIFVSKGIINWNTGLFFLVGMIIGGYLGAHTALKIGNVWLKRFLGIVVLLAGIKFLFF